MLLQSFLFLLEVIPPTFSKIIFHKFSLFSMLLYSTLGLHILCFCFFFFFDYTAQNVGSSFPDQELNPYPLLWNLRVLTTGLPGKSLPPVLLRYDWHMELYWTKVYSTMIWYMYMLQNDPQ